MDLSKCNCEKAGFCSVFGKVMGESPPNWKWCQDATKEERENYLELSSKININNFQTASLFQEYHINFDQLEEDIPTPSNKNAICTIAGNKHCEEQLEITRQNIIEYAKKCGADYVELTGDKCPEWGLGNKYRLKNVVRHYEKTLYLDCDIIVTKNAQNLFEHPHSHKMCFTNEVETVQKDEKFYKSFKNVRQYLCTILGKKFTYHLQPQAGILLLPHKYADNYSINNPVYKNIWTYDQHLMGINLKPEEYFILSKKYNLEFIDPEFWSLLNSEFFKPQFIHINAARPHEYRMEILKRIISGNYEMKSPNKVKNCNQISLPWDNEEKEKILKSHSDISFIEPGKFLTTKDLVEESTKLCEKLPPIKGVIGLPRSGMIPASVISVNMSVPLYSVSEGEIKKLHSTRSKDGGSRMKMFNENKSLPYLVVDDTSYSGAEIMRTKELFNKKYPKEKFLYTTIYSHPMCVDGKNILDIANVCAPYPHVLEWNFFNAHTSLYGIFDLDGVFCKDCPYEVAENQNEYEKWLTDVLPINSRIPKLFNCMAICTGRLEKYRPQTEEWLKKHGIKYNELIMFNGTKEERDINHLKNVGEYKSKVFNNYAITTPSEKIKPVYFIESCPHQSRLIAKNKIKNTYVISINEGVTL